MSFELITTAEDIGKVSNAIVEADVYGLDIETTALNPRRGRIRLVQVWANDTIYVVDLFKTGTFGSLPQAIEVTKGIAVVHNAKFEQKWLKHHCGIDIWPVFCTFRASAILHNGRNFGHNLYDVYARELDEYPHTEDLGASDWGGPLTEEQYRYAADDVTRLHLLRDRLKPQLKKAGLFPTALVEFGVILPESEIELAGIYLDTERWMALAEENKKRKHEMRLKLLATLPNPTNQLVLPGIEPPSKSTRTTKNVFNLDSNDQILTSLQKLGIKRKIKLENGDTKIIPIDTTAEIVLAQYASEYPLIKDIFKYREYSKNLQAFGPDYLKYVDPGTGRIHTEYWPFTGAGRYSSRKPNLQQIPRGAAFRSCFKAREGWQFVAADYSGIEMRIAAEVANDRRLQQVFKNGDDAHYATAALLNGCSVEEVTTEQRQQAKAVNFGLLYGMGAPKLVLYAMANYGVSLTLKQSEGFRNRYFDAYQGIKRWHKTAVRDGQRTGMARTLNGRLRYLDPETTYNEFLNTPVQGTGADALKKALRNVTFRLRETLGNDARIIHHVHDEIITEARDDPEVLRIAAEQVQAGMQEAMEDLLKSVPVEVEPATGPNWAEVH